MYPLRFRPLFQRYIWGGNRLATSLGKSIGDETAAESWEIVDHRDGQSRVAYGPLADKSLHELVVEYDSDLLGEQAWQRVNDVSLPDNLKLRFPLLFKFLDAADHLSVQVHPDDALGKLIDPPDLGKTEAWYVLDAEPGAKIYAGLQQDVTRAQFHQAVETANVEPLLYSFEAQAGDCVFIPAGTMHAIGKGLLIAEIQQASNTTYRVFDWNRTDDQGKGRPLHIAEALEATHFDRGPVTPVVADLNTPIQSLVRCQHFKMDRMKVDAPMSMATEGGFVMIACIEGAVSLKGDPADSPLQKGQTALIPACMDGLELSPENGSATLLKITP